MLPRVLVLVDDVSVELGRALFGGLRDDLWRINVSWVVATRGVDADELLAPPVDAFFETVIDLGPMPKDAVVELLARRWTGEEPTVSATEAKMLAEHAGGNPRRLIDLAREVVLADRSVDEIVAEFTALDDRLQVVSPQARTLAGELAGRGVAGPSDEALQQRMGLSRPRLIQLFSELEQAGIVHRLVQTAAGPGRPKQVYQLVPLHAHPSPHLTAGSGR